MFDNIEKDLLENFTPYARNKIKSDILKSLKIGDVQNAGLFARELQQHSQTLCATQIMHENVDNILTSTMIEQHQAGTNTHANLDCFQHERLNLQVIKYIILIFTFF